MNKTVEQHLEELIGYYTNLDFYIFPPDYIQKLIVRNLKDVLRRYNKYVKPIIGGEEQWHVKEEKAKVEDK